MALGPRASSVRHSPGCAPACARLISRLPDRFGSALGGSLSATAIFGGCRLYPHRIERGPRRAALRDLIDKFRRSAHGSFSGNFEPPGARIEGGDDKLSRHLTYAATTCSRPTPSPVGVGLAADLTAGPPPRAGVTGASPLLIRCAASHLMAG